MQTSEKESLDILTRRTLLKKIKTIIKASPGIALSASVPHFVLHEGQKTITHSFVINNAEYFPIYENHRLGPFDELPSSRLDVTFWELSTPNPNTLYSADPNSINLELQRITDEQSVFSPKSKNLLLKTIIDSGHIALGDVGTEKIDKAFSGRFTDFEKTKELAAFFAGTIAIFSKFLVPRRVQLWGSESITRRDFLKFITASTALAGTVPFFSSGPIVEITNLIDNKVSGEAGKAIANVIYRICGITSNFNPTDTALLYRNLLAADKILLLGEHYNHPKIGYKFGRLHQGIEDLLYLGRPLLHELLLTLYGNFIKENILDYGGDFLSKVRILKYAKPTNNVQERPVLIDEDIIIDTELQKKLNQRLRFTPVPSQA